MVKEKAILCGPFLGELWWEIFRFAPHILWKKVKYYKGQDIKLIIFTRPERFDIYGQLASILVPLRIKGDNETLHQECYHLKGLENKIYINLCNQFYNQFYDRFDIIEEIRPEINGNQYLNKNQYHKNEMRYDYIPRIENKLLVEQFIDNSKQCIILAPRYRKDFKRNWSNWNLLYNQIFENYELFNKYNFVICGKSPDYIPDNENRFLDINKILLSENSSLIGLTIEILKKSILTVGSQSAIPNLSLLLGVEALEWGHQKQYHSVTYNIKKTKVTFFEDMKYNISSNVVYEEMLKILNKKG